MYHLTGTLYRIWTFNRQYRCDVGIEYTREYIMFSASSKMLGLKYVKYDKQNKITTNINTKSYQEYKM